VQLTWLIEKCLFLLLEGSSFQLPAWLLHVSASNTDSTEMLLLMLQDEDQLSFL